MILLKEIGLLVMLIGAVWAAYSYGQGMFVQAGVGLASIVSGYLLIAFDVALQLLASIRDELRQLNNESTSQRSKS